MRRHVIGARGRIPEVPDLVPVALEQEAIAWRRHLHAHPELSFEEVETARFVEETLRSFEGLELSRPTPTSVVASLRGARPGKVLALRADIDALPIQEETGLEFASTRPGVMHACGHDGHTAMLLGVAKVLAARRDELGGEVRFVFQHAEEKPPGGARQLVDAGVMDGVDLVVGAHLVSIKEVGKVSCRVGPIAAAADTFSAEIRGRGGHAAMPHRTVDPVVVAAQVVANLQQLVSRTVDPLRSAVVSVTRFHAGTADNIIPEAVELGGTVRTFDPEVRSALREGMERVFRGVTEAHGAAFTLEYVEGYAALINDEEAAARVESAARAALGDDAIMDADPIMGGEDFSAYLEKAPGAFFWVGAGGEGAISHHHPRFTIDEAAFRSGIAVFVRTALDYLA
jgi:amidohydrolase